MLTLFSVIQAAVHTSRAPSWDCSPIRLKERRYLPVRAAGLFGDFQHFAGVENGGAEQKQNILTVEIQNAR